MKKTIEDYQEAIARIYALANKPEGLRNVSKMGDWLIEECTTALVKAGALVKSGDRGPVVFMWNPTRPERPTRGFCERIMRDVLERGRDRKHRARHPEQEKVVATGHLGVNKDDIEVVDIAPVQDTLFPMEENDRTLNEKRQTIALDRLDASVLVENLRRRGYKVECSRTEVL